MFLKLLLCTFLLVESFHVGDASLYQVLAPNRTRLGPRHQMFNSHKRMPQYMIQLYKELTKGGIIKRKMPYQANAIRGLNSVAQKESNSSMTIVFNLGYFKDSMTITRDEIHLYMAPPDPLDREIFKPFIVRLVDIHTNRLMRKFKIPAFNQGWQVLSLNRSTNSWVKDPSSNKGIKMTVYRARSPAVKNPLIDFPSGNAPYMILFASETKPRPLAWRFLMQYALNSVAGTTRKRNTRELSQQSQGRERVTRALSQQLTSGQQLRNLSQQCKAVKTDVNLTNFRVDRRLVIIHPQIYKMINCSNSCVMRPARSLFTQSSNGTKHEQYCCVPAKRLDLMVLLKDPSAGAIEAQVLAKFVPTQCKWTKQ